MRYRQLAELVLSISCFLSTQFYCGILKKYRYGEIFHAIERKILSRLDKIVSEVQQYEP
jgi:hypothetical protein